MARKPEDFLKEMLGQQALTIALLQSQIETLKEQVIAHDTSRVPDSAGPQRLATKVG